MRREVAAELEVEITAPTTLEFQIAVAPHPNTSVSEALSFVLDGASVRPMEISGTHGNRIHKLDVAVGNLTVEYSAAIVGRTDPAPVTEYDLSMYLRPSRYAEADKFYGFASTEFGSYVDSTTLMENVSSWVGTRLNYVPGSSDPIDGAVDTLLAWCGRMPRLRTSGGGAVTRGERAGPGRLGVRAGIVPDGLPCGGRGVRRRAVAGGRRHLAGAAADAGAHIATGRDAADTAFLDNHKGAITLNQLEVTAVVDGELPRDSIDQLVSIG